jgi:Ca-activated chloride channel homolog
MTAMAYGIEGKTSGLAASEVYDQAVKTAMTAIAQNTSRYGMRSGDLLSAMAGQGPRSLHAVAAFENDTVALNLAQANQLQFPLVFIFPSEGTFWTDQPFCILDRADWADPDAVEGANRFLDFALEHDQQVLATLSMLRPLDSKLPLGDRLTLANGTDPRVAPTTVPPLPEPSADLMRAVADMFQMTKRKATLLLVIDTSASMAGEKMRSAMAATVNFLKRFDPADLVGIETFSDQVRLLAPLQRVDDGETVAEQVKGLYAAGGTALYAAVCEAVDVLSERRRTDRAAGVNRLYGIVLVSDGQNSTADLSENEMQETCLRRPENGEPIRINSIAFGADADLAVLSRIATATGGTMFTADPQSIEKVYLNMSAEQ